MGQSICSVSVRDEGPQSRQVIHTYGLQEEAVLNNSWLCKEKRDFVSALLKRRVLQPYRSDVRINYLSQEILISYWQTARRNFTESTGILSGAVQSSLIRIRDD